MRRKVVVLNHFAVPLGAPGGTRHVELFSRLVDWDATVIAGNKNMLTQEPQASGSGQLYRTVWVSPFKTNGISRVLNWVSYVVTATPVALLRRRLDLVYASSPHLLTALAGWLVARIRRVPYVVEIRDLWPEILVDMGGMSRQSPIFRTLEALEGFIYRHADLIVVLAAGSVAAIENRGVSSERIVFIPNGADPEDFDVKVPRSELRARYGFDRFTLVYTGAHGPANGLGLLLDAAEELADENITFALVGDGVAKLDLIAEAKRRGLDNVLFLDPVPKSEIPELLAAADAGLHVLADVELFKYGVSPNKLFDYMAAGKPVITNTGGDVADMVNEAGSGFACESTGITSAARKMSSLSAPELNTFGHAGRRYMSANRSRSGLAAQLEMHLDAVAGIPSGDSSTSSIA